ncbi:MAG: hypothetical protein CMQ29_15690 [Gammaproteobacteria bacterium]|nr:hypothetical protein [Gammaproteobacteria bacterium]
MQFGLNRLDMTSVDAFARSSAQAEALGWSYGFIPSSPLLALDPYVMLSNALRVTSTLRMGPLIENPVMRNPAVLAGSTATIAGLAPGRVLLGMGAGDTAVRLMGKRPARIAEQEAAVGVIRALLAGEALDVDAQRPAKLRHAVSADVWVAAGGPRTLEMAGRVADGVFIRVGTHRENVAAAIAAVHRGAESVGRDPASVRYALIFHTVVCDDPERRLAVARSMAAGYLEYSPMLLEPTNWAWDGPPLHELQQRVWPDFHHARDLAAAGTLLDFVPEAVANAFCIAGTWAEVREAYTEAACAWPDAEVVVPHPVPAWPSGEGPAEEPYLEAFAREVIAPLAGP